MRTSRALAFLALAFVVAVPLLGRVAPAHHSRAAYDDEEVTLEGVVTEFMWRNRHVHIIFDVTGDNGEVVQWSGELSSITSMIAAGLSRDSFKPADRIKVTASVAANGAPFALLGSIWMGDGTKILDSDYRRETR